MEHRRERNTVPTVYVTSGSRSVTVKQECKRPLGDVICKFNFNIEKFK
jgi:hypothetical protein